MPFAIRVINDPEEGLDEFKNAPWDGVSTIEINTRPQPEPTQAGDEKQALDLLERGAASLHKQD
jgi:hypothetical protein